MRLRWAWGPVVALSLAVVGGAEETPAVPAQPAASPAPPRPEAAPRRRERVNRVVQLKNRDLLDAFDKILRQFEINVTSSRDLGVIVLSGPAEEVAAAEDAIRRFDRPQAAGSAPKNLAFTAHLLVARQQAGTGQPLPEELKPVIDQFRGVFAYKAYELLDTLAIRMADDRRAESRVDGLVRWPSGAAQPARTHLRLANARITGEDEKARSIRIPELTVIVELPIAVTDEGKAAIPTIAYRETIIKTGLDIREGQRVVVGKASFDGTNDALIVVLKVDIEG